MNPRANDSNDANKGAAMTLAIGIWRNPVVMKVARASYTVNTLNQYTQRTVPGYVDIKGLTLATNSVTVNSQTPYRKGEYFRKELSVANTSASVWQGITVTAPTETSVTGNVFVPKTQEGFTYDLDGNLTSDGRWTNRWDAENRLIEMETLSTVPTGAKKKLLFTYDHQGRRISKTVSNWVSSAWVLESTNRFVYDGWNLVAVLNGATLLKSFAWGTDLSGTMQGAGGVGGLIAFNDTTNVHFVAYDGNGNVTRLVKGSDGTTTADYEYGAFGEPMRVTGTAAKLNPFRFSTKYTDDESDLLYYGYRYYKQSAGRWLNRDPLGERGGLNLSSFVRNDPAARVDFLGLVDDLPSSNPDFPSGDFQPDPKNPNDVFWVPGRPRLQVGKCEIVILVGHGRYMPGELTTEGGCGYGAAYGCLTGGGQLKAGGKTVKISRVKVPEIPGAPKASRQEIDDQELIRDASRAFEAARQAAKGLCKKAKCGCASISIKTIVLMSMREKERNSPEDQAIFNLEKNASVIPCSE